MCVCCETVSQGLGGLGGIMYVCVVSLDYLCLWQVQVSVYYARRIPAHLRCTQCSILLHLIDIGFLTCICMCIANPDLFVCGSRTWSRIRPLLRGALTAIQRVRMIGMPKNGNRVPIAGGGRGRHNLYRVCHTAVTDPLRVGCVIWSQECT